MNFMISQFNELKIVQINNSTARLCADFFDSITLIIADGFDYL